MRRPYIFAVTAAGAALAAGLIAVPALATGSSSAAPAAAPAAMPSPSATSTTPCPCDTTIAGGGWGRQQGRGAGHARNDATPGIGRGAGTGHWGDGSTTADPLAGLAQGSLTADQKTKLAGMVEEEKLAHDVYVALAATTKDTRFTRIAAAESQHMTAIRALLSRYGVADPTAGKADGVFATDSVQQLYKDLVARGTVSLDAALAVGRDIENLDIKDLATAGSGVTAQDVTTVYTRLSEGSQRHLRAFGG
jgi:hypothetical protein